MIKSLYIRIVLIFLISVIGGTVLSFFVAAWVFEDKLSENSQLPLLNFGQDIARIYELLPLNEAEAYVSEMHQLTTYHVRIYDETGQFQSYGALNGYKPFTVTMDQVQSVLAGDTVQVKSSVLSTTLFGMPFATESGTRAMFIEHMGPSSAPFIVKWILNFSTYSLVAGSLVILASAMFLIKPIKELTKATRHVAEGNFNVKLNIKQQGELGTLARSFEDMMHDLQQLEQMRREFVSNVSHEIQSPLTSISGYALALKQENVDRNNRNRYLDIIIAESERMSKMSDSLLKLSLLESQSQQLQLRTFHLDEQIRRIIIALQPQWTARGIQFELHLAAIRVRADYDLLSQVWTNIIGNSIKFSNDNGVIHVTIQEKDNNVVVRISDTGIGIAEEDQKRIFERFFKADRSHSRKYSGSGMGLAIVKQIVALHNGQVGVESELGKGTAFIINLPQITIDSHHSSHKDEA